MLCRVTIRTAMRRQGSIAQEKIKQRRCCNSLHSIKHTSKCNTSSKCYQKCDTIRIKRLEETQSISCLICKTINRTALHRCTTRITIKPKRKFKSMIAKKFYFTRREAMSACDKIYCTSMSTTTQLLLLDI